MSRLIRPRTSRYFLIAVAASLLGLILLLVAYVNTPRTSDVLPAVTATLAPPTAIATVSVPPSPPDTATQEPAFSFGPMGEVATIEIQIATRGYFSGTDGAGTTDQTLSLQNNGIAYKGVSQYAGRYYRSSNDSVRTMSTTREITIPGTAVHELLRRFASFAFQKPPSPDSLPVTKTDCPNYYVYHLHTAKGVVSISGDTCSSVWDVEIDGGSFYVYTTIPDQVFSQIAPYLRHDIFDSFVKNETPVP